MSWQRVRGHEAVVAAFQDAVRRGRLAHAYLFTGPPGIGKRAFAGELAKALLCANRPPGRVEACDRCAECLLVGAGTHPDFLTLARPEDKVELPIDRVRDFCEVLSLKPARRPHKVAIVEDADDFNAESANCFLKTLEEPPPNSLLLLVATDAERLLPTVVSRCQVVHFAPLAGPVVEELLRAEGVEASAARRLARLSGGSPGRARDLADPALWDFRAELLGGITEVPVDSVRLARRWAEFVAEAGKEGGPQRRRASLVLGMLLEFLNDALRVSVGASPKYAEPGEADLLDRMSSIAGPEKLLRLIDRCTEADAQVDRRVQLVLVLEAMVDALGEAVASGC